MCRDASGMIKVRGIITDGWLEAIQAGDQQCHRDHMHDGPTSELGEGVSGHRSFAGGWPPGFGPASGCRTLGVSAATAGMVQNVMSSLESYQ